MYVLIPRPDEGDVPEDRGVPRVQARRGRVNRGRSSAAEWLGVVGLRGAVVVDDVAVGRDAHDFEVAARHQQLGRHGRPGLALGRGVRQRVGARVDGRGHVESGASAKVASGAVPSVEVASVIVTVASIPDASVPASSIAPSSPGDIASAAEPPLLELHPLANAAHAIAAARGRPPAEANVPIIDLPWRIAPAYLYESRRSRQRASCHGWSTERKRRRSQPNRLLGGAHALPITFD